MKTLIGIKLALLSVALSFLAQPLVWADEKMAECMIKDGQVITMDGKPMGKCVMMKDGKMMMTSKKSGKFVPMKKDMKMADGTICMVDGTCVMKDGTKMSMKEGDVMDLSSKMYHIKGLTIGQ